MACLFCQIVAGEIPTTIVHQGEGVTAFRDIAPQARVHVLVVPDQHIGGVAEVRVEDEAVVGRLLRVAADIARREGIEASGYRLIVNQGEDAGQSVPHLHVHIVGGNTLRLPLV